MLYRETGQFNTSYGADHAILPIRQDRIGLAVILAVAFVGVPLVLGLVVVIASALPARRILKLDPVEALRRE